MSTAADLMTSAVPRAKPGDTVGSVLAAWRRASLDEASHVYLLDDRARLVGQVPIETVLASGEEAVLDGLQGPPPLEVRPEDNAESAALLAVSRHETDVAVVDADRRLLGGIPVARLLALLHDEHVDDWLRMGGVGRSHPHPVAPRDGLFAAFGARLPWLLLGLAGGWLAAGIASVYEGALKQEMTLAFFLPLVVYMADAVGTQTETLLVRALAYGHVPIGGQLARESVMGLLLGGTVGALATLGMLIVDGRGAVAVVIGLTLAVTSVVATLVASLLPLGLARLGADPALASGPVATVLQDVLSVAVYLQIAMAALS